MFLLLFPFYPQEWIAPVALYKRATVSYSLFFKSKSRFRSQKTSNLLEKPKSEFPTLETAPSFHLTLHMVGQVSTAPTTLPCSR